MKITAVETYVVNADLRNWVFVRVLTEISAQELFRRDQDTLRLYKRWLHTRGSREADLLVRRGLIPWAPNRARRH